MDSRILSNGLNEQRLFRALLRRQRNTQELPIIHPSSNPNYFRIAFVEIHLQLKIARTKIRLDLLSRWSNDLIYRFVTVPTQ